MYTPHTLTLLPTEHLGNCTSLHNT